MSERRVTTGAVATRLHPRFQRPPVVEVVLGLQFRPLSAYRDPHAGLFWATRLGKESWPTVRVAPAIRESFERFGKEEQWGPVAPFEIRTGDTPDRTQLVNPTGDRMIQLQSTRFHYNWMRTDRDYPSYDTLLPEFLKEWESFRAFCTEEGLGEIKPNQWEVTYVNHVPEGPLWDRGNWSSLFPWLLSPVSSLCRFDSVAGTWHLVIGEDEGRLHVKLQRSRHPERGDVLVLELTARGPAAADPESYLHGLRIGHDAIVFTFAGMTSELAHDEWGRYQ